MDTNELNNNCRMTLYKLLTSSCWDCRCSLPFLCNVSLFSHLASVKAWGTVASVCRATTSDTIKLPNSFQQTHPTQSWQCWGLVIDIRTLAATNHAQTASWIECIMWFHAFHPETAWKDRTIPTKWNRIKVEEQYSPTDFSIHARCFLKSRKDPHRA